MYVERIPGWSYWRELLRPGYGADRLEERVDDFS